MLHNFCTMTEKDMFAARLQNLIINFGFIPRWHRKAFAKFCIKYKLIEKISGVHPTSYYVNHNFKYTATFHRVGGLFGGPLFELYADLFKSNILIHPTGYADRIPISIKKSTRRNTPIYDYSQILSDWTIE